MEVSNSVNMVKGLRTIFLKQSSKMQTSLSYSLKQVIEFSQKKVLGLVSDKRLNMSDV